MITSVQIAWVAGLLEGEGNFSAKMGSIAIHLGSTDLDVIEKYRSITKTTDKKIQVRVKDGAKTFYMTDMYRNLAVQWIMTIYPLMGIRRKEKIREILTKWKENKLYNEHDKELRRIQNSKENVLRRNVIKALMLAGNISREEAIKQAKEMGLIPTVQ